MKTLAKYFIALSAMLILFGCKSEAIKALEKARKLNDAENCEMAIKLINKHLEELADNPNAHAILGSCYNKQKEFVRAKKHLLTAKKLGFSPTNSKQFHTNLGTLLIGFKDYSSARKELQKAVDLGASGKTRCFLGMACLQLKDTKCARLHVGHCDEHPLVANKFKVEYQDIKNPRGFAELHDMIRKDSPLETTPAGRFIRIAHEFRSLQTINVVLNADDEMQVGDAVVMYSAVEKMEHLLSKIENTKWSKHIPDAQKNLSVIKDGYRKNAPKRIWALATPPTDVVSALQKITKKMVKERRLRLKKAKKELSAANVPIKTMLNHASFLNSQILWQYSRMLKSAI